jgi:crossover junction endodeoxyribonuclease RusA
MDARPKEPAGRFCHRLLDSARRRCKTAPVTEWDFELFVDGRPVPKGRPRVTNGYTYTPPRTVLWEQSIRVLAKSKLRGAPPLDGRLKVYLSFFGARSNADLDNLAKAVLDALNGVVYADDRQIDDLRLMRCSLTGEPAGVKIRIRRIAPEV